MTATKKVATKKTTSKKAATTKKEINKKEVKTAELTSKNKPPEEVRTLEGVVTGWETRYVAERTEPVRRTDDEGNTKVVGTQTLCPAILGAITIQYEAQRFTINFGRESVEYDVTPSQALTSEAGKDLMERLMDRWPFGHTAKFIERDMGHYTKRYFPRDRRR